MGWLGTSGGWFCSNHWGAPPCTICSLSHTRLMKAHSVHVTTKQPWRQSASRFCLWEGDMASIFKKHSDYLSNTISATNEILQPLQRNIWQSLTRYCVVGILEDCRAECLHWTKPVPHLLSVHGHVDGHIWRMKITHKFETSKDAALWTERKRAALHHTAELISMHATKQRKCQRPRRGHHKPKSYFGLCQNPILACDGAWTNWDWFRGFSGKYIGVQNLHLKNVVDII